MSNPYSDLLDPSREQLADAWQEIAGYPADESMLTKAYDAIYAWNDGTLTTSRGHDGKLVCIVWHWLNGLVHVGIAKR